MQYSFKDNAFYEIEEVEEKINETELSSEKDLDKDIEQMKNKCRIKERKKLEKDIGIER